ncbi:MAG: hypothetical protein WKF92_11240 [Pyrinomonadaceae bacterium]
MKFSDPIFIINLIHNTSSFLSTGFPRFAAHSHVVYGEVRVIHESRGRFNVLPLLDLSRSSLSPLKLATGKFSNLVHAVNDVAMRLSGKTRQLFDIHP